MPLKQLTISEDMAGEIERIASRNGISVQAQAEAMLRDSLQRSGRRETLLEAARRISAMTPKGAEQTPAEVLIREARDR
jgi:hypothetical protein